ncbi:hypothetical protein BD311DRAFT_767858 [Dichomitus squalens]|uniref:Uncharacterized protein n=1 Tax=Dichomitus squalens TaxID=114155 RepID=A0A4Q9MD99_9APHY|nr:hypothetical protein BD311DRAFT_767858 [Dichomitus squalens]
MHRRSVGWRRCVRAATGHDAIVWRLAHPGGRDLCVHLVSCAIGCSAGCQAGTSVRRSISLISRSVICAEQQHTAR